MTEKSVFTHAFTMDSKYQYWLCWSPAGYAEKKVLQKITNLKQNEAQSARAESTHKGVN